MYRRNASELGTADERLHGEGSGDDLDVLTAFSVHRSVEIVCLCPADGRDSSSWRSRWVLAEGRFQRTHKTRHSQHDVIQLRADVGVLPPTAHTENCTTCDIYWTATNMTASLGRRNYYNYGLLPNDGLVCDFFVPKCWYVLLLDVDVSTALTENIFECNKYRENLNSNGNYGTSAYTGAVNRKNNSSSIKAKLLKA